MNTRTKNWRNKDLNKSKIQVKILPTKNLRRVSSQLLPKKNIHHAAYNDKY